MEDKSDTVYTFSAKCFYEKPHELFSDSPACREVSDAIDIWCEDNKRGITLVVLPKKLYRRFKKEVRSTKLGRMFSKNGLYMWQAPVYKYSGDKIVIA